jgi:hypothetical protein
VSEDPAGTQRDHDRDYEPGGYPYWHPPKTHVSTSPVFRTPTTRSNPLATAPVTRINSI